MTTYNYNNPDYMPLRSLVVQPDATYVAPYREQVLVPKEKPKAELTAIPANKRPLSWQLQTAGENYDAVHNKVKDAWDKYLISPEDVKAANDYYENELMYEDFPGAIPLAALGSTLSGEAYNAWRDLQTDPANLIGGELLRGGKKIKNALGALYKGGKKVNPSDIATVDDIIFYHGSPKTDIDKFNALERLKLPDYDEANGLVFGSGDYVTGAADKAMQYMGENGSVYLTSYTPEDLGKFIRQSTNQLTEFEKNINDLWLSKYGEPLYQERKMYDGSVKYIAKLPKSSELDKSIFLRDSDVHGIGPLNESDAAEYVILQEKNPTAVFKNEGESNNEIFKSLNDVNPIGFMERYKMAPHLFR